MLAFLLDPAEDSLTTQQLNLSSSDLVVYINKQNALSCVHVDS